MTTSIDETAATASVAAGMSSHHHQRSSTSSATQLQSPKAENTTGAAAFKRLSMEVDGTMTTTTPESAASTRPTSMNTTFTEEPADMSSPESRRSLSFEPANAFLTAVAAQERRVLELREELHKAETELTRLKTRWAQQEAVKKRQEIRTHTEAMRPLTSPTRATTTSATDRSQHRSSMSIEEERKRVMQTRTKVPERRVFTGRHTRTLSLLSPGTMASFSPEQQQPQQQQGNQRDSIPQTPLTGASIDSKLAPEARVTGRPHSDSKGTKDDLVNTGRQLVGDLRDGLWSFWDDLRQATIGDEAAQEHPQRRLSQARSPARPNASSRNSSSSSLQAKGVRKASRSPHARSNTIAVTPSASMLGRRAKANALGIVGETGDVFDSSEDGGWSNWDSPTAAAAADGKADASVVVGTGPPSSASNTPRSSVSGNDDNDEGEATGSGGIKSAKIRGKRPETKKLGPSSEQMGLQSSADSDDGNALPWPALHKLNPGNLQRKAGHLMKEWERSLTPPAEEHERDWIDRYIDGSGSSARKKKQQQQRQQQPRSPTATDAHKQRVD